MTVIYKPHVCELGEPYPHGTIVRCSCGRLYRAHWPGNPAYGSWCRLGPLGRLVHRRRLP